ncbi:MAG: ABC transporter permease [Tissierellia bacterium]|nr:ABC transporter permease [Tissierellia bacterium]
MRNIGYLIHRKILDSKKEWKGFVVYFLIFYLGILLPAFSWGNFSYLKRIEAFMSVSNYENVVHLDWFSDKSVRDVFDSGNMPFITAFKRIEIDDVTIFTVLGTDGKQSLYKNVFMEYKGRKINEDDDENGELICTVNSEFAKLHGFSLGNYLKIGENDYKIVGICKDVETKGLIEIPLSTFEKYILKHGIKVQYSGIFSANNGQSTKDLGDVLQSALKDQGIDNGRVLRGLI